MISRVIELLILAILCATLQARSFEGSRRILQTVDPTALDSYGPDGFMAAGVFKASPFIDLPDNTPFLVETDHSGLVFNKYSQVITTKEELTQGSFESSGISGNFAYKLFGIGGTHRTTTDKMNKEISTGKTVIVTVTITVTNQSVVLVPDASIIAPKFVQDVEELPTKYDKRAYNKFMNTYGSTIITEMTTGAILRSIYSLNRESYEKYTNEGHSAQQDANIHFGGFLNIDGDKSSAEYKNQTSNFTKTVKTQYIRIIGGDPVLIPGKDFSKFIDSVKTRTAVIDMALESIMYLFNEKYLPNVTDLDQKRQNLDQAVGDYLDQRPSCESGCNEPHGKCVDSKHGYSYCRCNPGYKGITCSYPKTDHHDCEHLVVSTTRPPGAIGKAIWDLPVCVITSDQAYVPISHYVYRMPGKSVSGGCLAAYTMGAGTGVYSYEEVRGLTGNGNHTTFAMFSTRRDAKGIYYCDKSNWTGTVQTSLGLDCHVTVTPTSQHPQGFSCSAVGVFKEGLEISLSGSGPLDGYSFAYVERPFIDRK